MKNIIYKKAAIALSFSLTLILTSCEKWLSEPSPGVTELGDFFSSGQTAIQSVNAAYVPLTWQFNGTYFSEWFIGDIVSDDALKGGQGIADMGEVYELENFKTQSNNPLLLQYYRAQYQGIARCNLVLQEIPKVDPDAIMDQRLKDRLIGEAKFLRAYYYSRLVRVFGSVPKVDFVVESSSQWKQPRATVTDLYNFIIEDLKDAETKLWKKSEYPVKDLGRATKAAAQSMLLKTYLIVKNYPEAEKWGEEVVKQARDLGEYNLLPNYKDNFTLAGENGRESIFEIQYMEDPTSDYGEGFGFTRGNFSVVLTRSRSALIAPEGWGFNKPTQNLYDAYEAGDPRRDITILNPTDAQMESVEQETYLGTRYLNRKYAMLEDGAGGSVYSLTHPSRAPINIKEIRYADVLLMYAEACVETNNLTQAKWALEEVRNRARNGNAVLPEFPNYNSYADNKVDLGKAIRHERRVELAMEGHRWFDICRWGQAKAIMDAYKLTETPEARQQMAEFISGVHETFPIPEQEINLGDMGN